MMFGTYYDTEVNRFRDNKGRFFAEDTQPDEKCPNGCERYGEWWVPDDCPTHLGVQ